MPVFDNKKALAVDCAIVAFAAVGLVVTAVWIAHHISVSL